LLPHLIHEQECAARGAALTRAARRTHDTKEIKALRAHVKTLCERIKLRELPVPKPAAPEPKRVMLGKCKAPSREKKLFRDQSLAHYQYSITAWLQDKAARCEAVLDPHYLAKRAVKKPRAVVAETAVEEAPAVTAIDFID
jgi:hypothetical protein